MERNNFDCVLHCRERENVILEGFLFFLHNLVELRTFSIFSLLLKRKKGLRRSDVFGNRVFNMFG